MLINISKESLSKNKYSIIVTLLLLVSAYFFVIPKLTEYVMIRMAEYKISSIIDEQGEEMLALESEHLENEELLEIQKLKKSYEDKRSDLKTKYSETVESYKKELIRKKTDAIIYGNDDQNIGYVEKADIQMSLLRRLGGILTKSSKFVEERIEKIELSKTLKLSTGYSDEKKEAPKSEKYETKAFKFSLDKKSESGSIIIYDTSKIGFPIDLGIVFPTMFSYKAVGINPGERYYDLHKGTDLKTMPYKNIVISFPENKEGKVVYANEDGYGKRLIIDVPADNERYEYAHLEDIGVKVGDKIVGNQKIATTGNTGEFTKGYHLHYTVYKDGFLSTYDWGMDIDRETLVKETISAKEASFIVPYLKKVPANVPQAMGLYAQLPTELRNAQSFDKVMAIIADYEANGKFGLGEVLDDEFFKKNIKKTKNEALAWTVKFVDEIDEKRKAKFIAIIKANPEKDWTVFDQGKIAPKPVAKKSENSIIQTASAAPAKESVSDFSFIDEKLGLNKFNFSFLTSAIVQKRKSMMYFPGCAGTKSTVFEKYVPLQSVSDGHILDENSIKNVNKLYPIILSAIKDGKFVSRVNEKMGFSGDNGITECDLVFMEMGKWYKEHTLALDNPNAHGIFQNLSQDYHKRFPNEKGAKVLSDDQYYAQSMDSLEHSFGKLTYLNGKTSFRGSEINSDFILKYWAWSYNGLVGTNPDLEYYVSNNMTEQGLTIKDVAAKPGRKGEKDGAFTLATKLYILLNQA